MLHQSIKKLYEYNVQFSSVAFVFLVYFYLYFWPAPEFNELMNEWINEVTTVSRKKSQSISKTDILIHIN